HRGDAAAEETGRVDQLQVAKGLATLDGKGTNRCSTRQHDAYFVEIVPDAMGPEDGERVPVCCPDDSRDRAGMDGKRLLLGALRRGFGVKPQLGGFVHVRDPSPIISRTPATGMSIQSGR